MVRNRDPIERLRSLLGPEDEIIISNTNGGIELTVDRDHLEMLLYFKMFCYILCAFRKLLKLLRRSTDFSFDTCDGHPSRLF